MEGNGWINVNDELPKETAPYPCLVDGYKHWQKRWFNHNLNQFEDQPPKVTHWARMPDDEITTNNGWTQINGDQGWPDEGVDALVLTRYGMAVCNWKDEGIGKWWNPSTAIIGDYGSGAMLNTQEDDDYEVSVKYWKPLPPAPIVKS